MALTKLSTNSVTSVDGIEKAGIIKPYGGTTAPTGYLSCDGATVSRTTYSGLFSAIGTTWGAGDGSSTFTLPDLRAAFLRGTGTHGSSTDGDSSAFTRGNVGTYENDQIQSHGHTIGFYNYGSAQGSSYRSGSGGSDWTGTTNKTSMIESTGGRSGSETRPFNASILYVIKT